MNLNRIEWIRNEIVISFNKDIVAKYDDSVDQVRLTQDIALLQEYNDITDYACNLFVLISSNKYFEKANLQTALLSTDFFLHKNGYYLNIDDDLAVDLLKQAKMNKYPEVKKMLKHAITVL